MATKTCPITRDEFNTRAKAAKVTLEYPDGATKVAYVNVKAFESGSVGWSLSDKWTPCLDGRDVPCQVGLNITAIGSKDLPKV